MILKTQNVIRLYKYLSFSQIQTPSSTILRRSKINEEFHSMVEGNLSVALLPQDDLAVTWGRSNLFNFFHFLLLIFFFILSFLFTPKVKAAVFEGGIDEAPKYIDQSGTPFLFHFSGTELEPNTEYYVKLRIHKPGENTYYGFLWHNQWLSQNSSWANFPVFTTDNDGFISGWLVAKNSSATSGSYLLQLAIRKKGTSTTDVSSVEKSVDIIESNLGGTISGYVFDEKGNLLTQAVIKVKNQAEEVIGMYLSEDNDIDEGLESNDGYYKIFVPAGENYSLEADDFENNQIGETITNISITAGQNLTNVNINAPPNEPPEAKIEVNKTTAYLGEILEFDASESLDLDGVIKSFSWDFGDGTIISGEKVKHTFKTAGSFKVILTVRDDKGGEAVDQIEISILKPNRTFIIINELLPKPNFDWNNDSQINSGDEWIELKNISEFVFNLEGWILKDKAGKTYIFPANSILEAGKFLIIYKSTSGISLNDSGGEVLYLLYPDGIIADYVEYTDPVKSDYAFARDKDGNFYWTVTPTKNAENKITSESEKEKEKEEALSIVSIKTARHYSKGAKVKVKGIVSVRPGVLGARIFYIQDGSAGIQIYLSFEGFPNLKIGDKIQVIGELSESYGEKRIKIRDPASMVVLSHNNSLPIIELKIGQIGECWEGYLVAVRGMVTRKAGRIFYLTDGWQEIKIYAKSQLINDLPKIGKNDFLWIAGIVSQYRSNYRLLPRQIDDILILKKALKAKKIQKSISSKRAKIWKSEKALAAEKDFDEKNSSSIPLQKEKNWIDKILGLIFISSSFLLAWFIYWVKVKK